MRMIKEVSLDAVKVCERDMSLNMGARIDKMNEYLKATVGNMNELTTKSAVQLATSTKNIKEVCSQYFQKFELDLEEQKLKLGGLENKYRDWSKVLIEPHSLNDARVFSLETRIQQEEDLRIKEFKFMQELIRKLAYSMEQLGL